jgi:hypothetical protein
MKLTKQIQITFFLFYVIITFYFYIFLQLLLHSAGTLKYKLK